MSISKLMYDIYIHYSAFKIKSQHSLFLYLLRSSVNFMFLSHHIYFEQSCNKFIYR